MIQRLDQREGVGTPTSKTAGIVEGHLEHDRAVTDRGRRNSRCRADKRLAIQKVEVDRSTVRGQRNAVTITDSCAAFDATECDRTVALATGRGRVGIVRTPKDTQKTRRRLRSNDVVVNAARIAARQAGTWVPEWAVFVDRDVLRTQRDQRNVVLHVDSERAIDAVAIAVRRCVAEVQRQFVLRAWVRIDRMVEIAQECERDLATRRRRIQRQREHSIGRADLVNRHRLAAVGKSNRRAKFKRKTVRRQAGNRSRQTVEAQGANVDDVRIARLRIVGTPQDTEIRGSRPALLRQVVASKKVILVNHRKRHNGTSNRCIVIDADSEGATRGGIAIGVRGAEAEVQLDVVFGIGLRVIEVAEQVEGVAAVLRGRIERDRKHLVGSDRVVRARLVGDQLIAAVPRATSSHRLDDLIGKRNTVRLQRRRQAKIRGRDHTFIQRRRTIGRSVRADEVHLATEVIRSALTPRVVVSAPVDLQRARDRDGLACQISV